MKSFTFHFFLCFKGDDLMIIDDLIDAFHEAQEDNSDICVEVTIPGQKDTEFIINRNKSLANKLEYYCNTYDENLVHKHNKEIRIVSATPIEFLCEL